MTAQNPDQIAGKSVLCVMAAEAELGVKLRKRIAPLITGVGPVEAAISLTAALANMQKMPDLILSVGSAGSARLEQAGIYQISHVSYRDMDASPLGFERGRTPFLDQPVQIPLPCTIPGIPGATLSTGANIVSGPAYAQIAEDMVDMETYAHLRVAQRYDIPLIGLRGVSDGNDELRQISDWTRYLKIIDEKLANAIDLLEQSLQSGQVRI